MTFDSGVYDNGNDPILIFSTDERLDALVMNTNWYIDGTFKCALDIFSQGFTVHTFIAVSIISVLNALLPNKRPATYE